MIIKVYYTMRVKVCHTCNEEKSTMFRVQLQKGKLWVFVCESCCKNAQKLPDYKYGGTWKG